MNLSTNSLECNDYLSEASIIEMWEQAMEWDLFYVL